MATEAELRVVEREMCLKKGTKFLRSKTAARCLGVSQATLSSFAKSGAIPRLKYGNGFMYRIEDLVDFIKCRAQMIDAKVIRSGSVYVITADEYFPIVKIGFTKTPTKHRLANMETSNPFNLYILADFETAFPEKAEALVHQALDHRRLRREWFRLEDGDLETIKSVVESAS